MDKDRPSAGGEGKKSGIFLFLLLLAITVGAALLIYARSRSNLEGMNVKEAFASLLGGGSGRELAEQALEFDYDSRQYSVFAINKDYLIRCTPESVTWYDKSGRERKTAGIMVNKPIARTAGSYLLVADASGRELYLFKGQNLMWNKRTEGSLINADVSEDGFITAVEKVKGYKAKVEVYDPQLGEPLLLTRTIAECFVLGARISPSGKELFINKVDASDISSVARLEFSEMFSEAPFADIKLENAIFPAVEYLSDDSVLASGDSLVVYLDRKKDVKWKKRYGERQVYGAVSLDKYAVLAVDEKEKDGFPGRSIDISVIRLKDGREAASFQAGSSIVNFSAAGSTIAVNTGREAKFFDIRGRETGIYRSRADMESLLLFDGNTAAAVTKSKIILLKIK